MLPLLLLFLSGTDASPTMCHCPNGGLGMTCPSPITLNCPPQQCPPAPPCNPFPTIPTIDPNNNGLQGLSQFTFPTLAPLGGSPFSGLQATTPLPLPVAPPTNGQESLLPIANQAHGSTGPISGGSPPTGPIITQPVYAQPTPAAYQQAASAAVYPGGPQVNVQAPTYGAATVPPVAPVDSTTRATTLSSEQYVEQDSPESDQQQVHPSGDKPSGYGVFENEPNNGFRQPVRRALAPSVKPEMFSEKCNDERLKKIIEQNVDSNPSTSKRKIQKAATDEIGGLFDVICSAHDFSYLANTQLFCEAGNDDVTCFAFLHSLIQ